MVLSSFEAFRLAVSREKKGYQAHTVGGLALSTGIGLAS